MRQNQILHYFLNSDFLKEVINWIHFGRLSFALSTSKIKEKARVVAMDLRGHGKSSSENDLDLSVEVQIINTRKKYINMF